MSKPKVLIQLDTDRHPSVFDSMVAIDAGVERLLRQGSVTPENVREMVHGAIFTRGPDDLWQTALFIGGVNVAAGEAVLAKVKETFFGAHRVSVMLDPGGANTTAAAAVLAAGRHIELANATVLVLASTGPAGQRAVRLLAQMGAKVRCGSRTAERAEAVCAAVTAVIPEAQLTPAPTGTASKLQAALDGVQVVISAGSAGVELLSEQARKEASDLVVAIDLNAVPPLGLAGIEVIDKAVDRDGVKCYGALGVGGTKMKIHKAAIHALFEANDKVFDAEELFQLGQGL